MNIAAVDWDALSAIAGTLVFGATLALAFSTWNMAKAAQSQAAAASKQADAAEDQASAAARSVEIAQRQLEVTSEASLKIVRGDGGFGRVHWLPANGESHVRVMIQNLGQSPATLEQPTLQMPGGVGMSPGRLDEDAPLAGTPRPIYFVVDQGQFEKAIAAREDWTVIVPYRDSGSNRLNRFVARLRPKRNDDESFRWIVAQEQIK